MSNINTIEEFRKRYQYDPVKDQKGAGGFGSVYKAIDTVRHREVAIKIAAVKTSSSGKKTFSLRDEVMAVSKLPDHPNVAHYEKDELYTFTLSNGVFDYAVMQYYPYGNLDDAIRKGMSMSQKEDVAHQLLEGIAFLHKHKVVHRDLKPANILVVRQGDRIIPVIIDFGLSKSVDATLFGNSVTGGTRRYSAPEQLQGNQTLQINVDLWSYGVILFELFTGKPLFAADSDAANSEQAEKEIYDKIVNGKMLSLQKMPDKWQEVAQRCLVVDPKKRAQSAEELMEIIGTGDGGGGDDDKMKKYIKLGAAALVAIGVVALLLLWPKPKPDENDDQRFQACQEVNDYRLYLKDFPDGKHREKALQFVENFVKDSVESVARKPQVAEEPVENVLGDAPRENDIAPIVKPDDELASKSDPVSTSEPQPVVDQPASVLHLSYGDWTGNSANGKPDGEGRLVMTKAHSFGGQNVEAGMVVEAIFDNGELVMGQVYDRQGKLISTIVP